MNTLPAPHVSSPMTVRPEWIDHNGHMNMAYYSVLFDRGGDEMYPLLGLGPDYRVARGLTTYTAEFHICYLRELKLGDRVAVHSQLLDFDEKRFISFHTLWHSDGWCAATGEALTLHVDADGPRVIPFPGDVRDRLASLKAAHATLPRPAASGRSIGLANRRVSG